MATTSPAQGTKPKLEDFPDAEIVGGAVICNGENMGTLMVTGDVEPNAAGSAYLANPPEAVDYALTPVDVTNPAPPGVFNPLDHEPVKAVAKREVRRRKQNEVNIDAMNSPTEEEETAMKAADEALAAGEELPPDGELSADGQRKDGLEPGRRPSGHPGSGDQAPQHQPRAGSQHHAQAGQVGA